jgi:hypothetical protein
MAIGLRPRRCEPLPRVDAALEIDAHPVAASALPASMRPSRSMPTPVRPRRLRRLAGGRPLPNRRPAASGRGYIDMGVGMKSSAKSASVTSATTRRTGLRGAVAVGG